MEEAANDLGAGSERWVRDDVEAAPREPKVPGVDSHDRDGVEVAEPGAESADTIGVEFDRDDAMAGRNERSRDRPVTGADIDDESMRWEVGVGDESFSGACVEPVPPPTGGPGHGTPSRSSSSS